MNAHALRLRELGIDTRQEHVIYMRRDCHVCRAEGFEAQARVEVRHGGKSVLATLNVVDSRLLAPGEASLSTNAWRALDAREGGEVSVSHAPALDSLGAVRAKVYGHRFETAAIRAVVRDIAAGRYSDIQLAAFISACAGGRMDLRETTDLTMAMVEAGDRLSWGASPIADKHCVGGLPGNRTTPIVVAIATAAGLTMPKTSSRAITSPAGTADVLETMTRVDLDLPAMRRVVEQQRGCFVWGGALTLSPADDILIRVERPLDIDSDAQLVASVLSKKIAAGATHVLIDIPVGPTAKVRTADDAAKLKAVLVQVANAAGLQLRVMLSDGTQPVGRGIGPALEARDVLAVLRRAEHAPVDLRNRALDVAGALLEHCGHCPPGSGHATATQLLDSGDAWRKFRSICDAQGGFREPGIAPLREVVVADQGGVIEAIDNRRLARVAKLAGAPTAATAGVEIAARVGDVVARGQPLLSIHAEAQGELAYARDYLSRHPVFRIRSATLPVERHQ